MKVITDSGIAIDRSTHEYRLKCPACWTKFQIQEREALDYRRPFHRTRAVDWLFIPCPSCNYEVKFDMATPQQVWKGHYYLPIPYEPNPIKRIWKRFWRYLGW